MNARGREWRCEAEREENKGKSERWRPGKECETEGKEKMMHECVGEWEMENMRDGKG